MMEESLIIEALGSPTASKVSKSKDKNGTKPKRQVFSVDQRKALERAYEIDAYWTVKNSEILADIKLTKTQIQGWFYNTRSARRRTNTDPRLDFKVVIGPDYDPEIQKRKPATEIPAEKLAADIVGEQPSSDSKKSNFKIFGLLKLKC